MRQKASCFLLGTFLEKKNLVNSLLIERQEKSQNLGSIPIALQKLCRKKQAYPPIEYYAQITSLSTYIINTYRNQSRLFITGGCEIPSQKGTTQGDLLALPWYSINTTSMIQTLRMVVPLI